MSLLTCGLSYPPCSTNRAGNQGASNIATIVINSLSSVLTADNFIQAAARIGTSFPNATVYGTNLFPGRRDGLDKVRTAVYYASCKCLRFRTPPFQPD